MSSPVWTIKRGSDGLEQSVAAWGLSDMQTDYQNAGQDKVTFRAVVQAADGAAIFNDFDTAIVYRTDPVTGAKVSWFSGLWTKTPRNMTSTSETISYELSGPWWYLSHCSIQTAWMASNGISPTLTPILKALQIIGLNPSLEAIYKIDLFTYMTLALQYCISACATQGVPFVPFTVGTISATDFIVPWEQVKNLSCSQLIQHCLRWIPDASFWFDYSITPATVHIMQRPALTAVNMPAFGGLVGAIKLTPRTDLQVSNVVCKYDQTNTIDGKPQAVIFEDVYPVGSSEFNLRALVATASLQGGSATYQHQDVSTTPLPLVGVPGGSGIDAVAWFEKHCEWLFGTTSSPSTYDTTNITMAEVLGKDLWAQDPYATGDAPTGFTVNGMVNELVGGAITKWMTDDQDLFGAFVVLSFKLSYSGSDQTTSLLFQNDPANPNTRIEYVRVKATNADTDTYSQLASADPSEPPPTGLAQNLYNAMSVLQYEGSIELTEQECSGQVHVGNVLNLTGTLAAWTAMNAQVISVVENIKDGKTTVRFGPSKNLSLDEYVELYQAMRVRRPTESLTQRTTGDASKQNIIGHIHSPHSSTSSAPGGGSAGKALPFAGTIAKVGGVYVLQIGSGFLQNSQVQGDVRFISGLNVPLSINQTAGSTDFAYLEQAVTSAAASGNAVVNSGSAGGTYDPTLLAWDAGGKGYLANDGAAPPNQTFFRIQIGTITTGPAVGGVIPAPVYTPGLINNLLIFDTFIAGQPAVMAYPSNSAS